MADRSPGKPRQETMRPRRVMIESPTAVCRSEVKWIRLQLQLYETKVIAESCGKKSLEYIIAKELKT